MFAQKALVLSDNDGFSKVVKVHLEKLSWEVTKMWLSSVSQIKEGDFDLIVVALSSSINDPAVMLSRIVSKCKQTPVVVISEKPFRSSREGIVHLNFPFNPTEFDQVTEMLGRRQSFSDGMPRPKPALPMVVYARNEIRQQAEYWIG